jgi:hypothetical protein
VELEAAVLARAAQLANAIFPAGASPGEAAARQSLDALIEQLEAVSPEPLPLSAGARPRLSGRWRLVYASAGTVVTASVLGSVLRTLSVLPFVGLEEVEQEIGDELGRIVTTNAAKFGLGPFGTFLVTIFGVWQVAGDQVAEVSFDRYSVKMVNVLGLPLPVPGMEFPVPNSRLARFSTPYLSDRVRVSRGQSGNCFLFVRVLPGEL